MTPHKIEKILKEAEMRSVRSAGKGGQHVNKVSTKIELRFNVLDSFALTQNEKSVILKKSASKITDAGDLLFSSQASRSQFRNRDTAKNKLIAWIEKCLTPQKKRIAGAPSPASKEKRLKEKRNRAELKKIRQEKLFD